MEPEPASRASWVWMNGAWVPREEAALDIEDRAALFGDAVYEVIRYDGGVPLALAAHARRLERSLGAMRIPVPGAVGRMEAIGGRLLELNALADASVYWQVSRGAGPRRHLPEAGMAPTVFAIARPAPPLAGASGPACCAASLLPDERWGRCDVKTVMLAPLVLAGMAARDRGADTAILHRDGLLSESVSANVMIVEAGRLLTPPADRRILAGITRGLVLELARAEGIPVAEVELPVARLHAAEEVLLSGTTTHVAAVTAVEGEAVGGGAPGPVTRWLHRLLTAEIHRRTASFRRA